MGRKQKALLLTADNLRIGRFMYTDWLVLYTPFGICVGCFGLGRSSLGVERLLDLRLLCLGEGSAAGVWAPDPASQRVLLRRAAGTL